MQLKARNMKLKFRWYFEDIERTHAKFFTESESKKSWTTPWDRAESGIIRLPLVYLPFELIGVFEILSLFIYCNDTYTRLLSTNYWMTKLFCQKPDWIDGWASVRIGKQKVWVWFGSARISGSVVSKNISLQNHMNLATASHVNIVLHTASFYDLPRYILL